MARKTTRKLKHQGKEVLAEREAVLSPCNFATHETEDPFATPHLLSCWELLKDFRQTGGFPNLDLSFLFCPFLSFWDFPGDFPDLSGDSPGIFPIGPFPLSRPIKSPYEEQSRKGPRHNLDLSRKRWETPGFGNTPV